MEVQIDKQLKKDCNVNLGCIFYIWTIYFRATWDRKVNGFK